jgi:thioesterase domain-containing protein
LELLISEIWCGVLQLNACESISATFFEMGGNSLLTMLFLGKLNTTFSTEFSLKDLFEKFTIRQVAKKIMEGKSPTGTPLVSINQQDRCKPSLYILPGNIGCSSAYYPLGSLLSRKFSVKCIEAKGLYGECAPHYDLHEMLNDYSMTIKNDAPTEKLFLLGHSSGCMHVVELSYKLQKEGFIVDIILLDGPVSFYSNERLETYSDEIIESESKVLLWAIKKLYALSYLQDVDIESTSTTLQSIAYYLFPDNSIHYDYKLKVAQGFVDVFFAQRHLNANRVFYESYGQVQDKVNALFVGARDEDPVKGEAMLSQVCNVIGKVTAINSSGDHLTMISNQHVAELAEKIIAFAFDLLATEAKKLIKSEIIET